MRLLAMSIFAASCSALAVHGRSVGISRTVVTPPRAAACVPEEKSSLCVSPGSRRCACTSTRPGSSRQPETSKTLLASTLSAGRQDGGDAAVGNGQIRFALLLGVDEGPAADQFLEHRFPPSGSAGEALIVRQPK